MNLLGLNRPDAPGVSKEKLGIAGAFAAILGWALLEFFGLDVPEDILLAVATILLGLVGWRARNRRAEE